MGDRLKGVDMKDPRVLIPLATALGVPAVALIHYARRKRKGQPIDDLTGIFEGLNTIMEVDGGRRDIEGYMPYVTQGVERRYPPKGKMGLARLGRDLSSLKYRIDYIRERRAEMLIVAAEYGITKPEVIDSAARNLDTIGTTIAPFIRRAVRSSIISSGITAHDIHPGDQMWPEVQWTMNHEWPIDDSRRKRHGLNQDPASVYWVRAEQDGKFLGYAVYTYEPDIDISNFDPSSVFFPKTFHSDTQGQGAIMVVSKGQHPDDKGLVPMAAINLAMADVGRAKGMPVIDPYLSRTALRRMRVTGEPYSQIWNKRYPDGSHADVGRNIEAIFALQDLGATDNFMEITGDERELRKMGLPIRQEGTRTIASAPAGFMLLWDPQFQEEDIEADLPIYTS